MPRIFTSLADPDLIQLIMSGAVGIIPTDTVYGLVARAKSSEALERFFAVKSRNNEPGTIIGANPKQFEQLGFDSKTLVAAASYWPNAISIVLDATSVRLTIKQRRTALPLRIPAVETLRTLLEITGPLMTTSANQPGLPTATTINEAQMHFGETVDFYVDGGIIDHPPSTIIEISPQHEVIVHRNGSVPIA